jgi:hypothetical protein
VFRVRVYQRLFATDGLGWLSRELELPFAPFPRLMLSNIGPDDLYVEHVEWDAADRSFRVYLFTDDAKAGTLCGAARRYGKGWTFRPDKQPRVKRGDGNGFRPLRSATL